MLEDRSRDMGGAANALHNRFRLASRYGRDTRMRKEALVAYSGNWAGDSQVEEEL